ncbi:MAG: PH domain-containing protein [Bacteroides sp.]|nr:PH domain-containing protein [Bacteroides sp.]
MTTNRRDEGSGDMHYPSKRDLWIIVVICVTAIVLIVAALNLIDAPMVPFVKYPLVLACLAGAILSIWILFSTGYTLTSDKLIARCGPFTNKVSLDAIETISPSRSPLASPACSLDQLHIRYYSSESGLLVSPIDKHAFLEALVARCSNLELKGDTVIEKDT